jgi:hypothetical protein
MESFALVLIDGEFRSLIRSFCERSIGSIVNKPENKKLDVLNKIAIRAVASLIAIQIYKLIKSLPERLHALQQDQEEEQVLVQRFTYDNIRKYITWVLIIMFIVFRFVNR